MQTGTIKKLVRVASPAASGEEAGNEGYGIIRGQDGHDVYFVSSSVRGCPFDELASGQGVRYAVEEGPLGRASAVVPVDET